MDCLWVVGEVGGYDSDFHHVGSGLHHDGWKDFWLKYRDNKGDIVFRTTGFRHDTEDGRKKANELKHAIALKELSRGGQVQTEGWVWVQKALSPSFRTEASKQRTLGRWDIIESFLLEKGIHRPSEVTPETTSDYMEWRTTKKRRSGKTTARNTAIYEVGLFKRIMDYAVERKYVQTNPLGKIRLVKSPTKPKPALTDSEISTIRLALGGKPDWMKVAFEIALATGCRLRETSIPLDCINFDQGTITFPSPKGGPEKAFTIPMPTAIRGLLESLKGRRTTCDIPRMASKQFGRDFLHRELGMSHLCFHCLRVTKITRMMLERVPLSMAMRLVNHSNELIHRIYQRHSVDDLIQYRDSGAVYANQGSPR
ncbi:MAG: hypothetical protein EBZ44_04730 [Verrucomicrobia bacterium]|nr:hypothetical protein [bacterium]NDA26268.1 hypothetical protein [Verrucomicrobiota bacterium]NDD57009.1 hypothetical protein [Verrucomicrobiota bacterium]